MRKRNLIWRLAVLATLVLAACPVEAQYWTATATSAPDGLWQTVVCSRDGTQVFARGWGQYWPGVFYYSADSGKTWTSNAPPDYLGYFPACSGDGRLLVSSLDQSICLSTNHGVTWEPVNGPTSSVWRAFASSFDGSRLLAAASEGTIYTSADSGVTWTSNAVTNSSWTSAYSSLDGMKLLAVGSPATYSSVDGGATWITNNFPAKVGAASSDLSHLAALGNGHIYLSADSGATWTVTTAPTTNWAFVTCSDDARKIVAAVDGENLYISTDAGATWSPVGSLPANTWISLASSSDGTQVYAAVDGGNSYGVIYTLSQSSAVLSATDVPANNWVSFAASADGTRWIAATDGHNTPGLLYTSTNGGKNWTLTSAPNQIWQSVYSSADGSILIAVSTNVVDSAGAIYVSTDGGLTWSPANAPPANWISVAGSSDGKRLYAAIKGGQVCSSMDGGASWQPCSLLSATWKSIASSADGVKLAAVGFSNHVYLSTDSGTNWAPSAPFGYWGSVCSSADGTKLAAGGEGAVYVSYDSGTNWAHSALPPWPGNSGYSQWFWLSLACSADGCTIVAPTFASPGPYDVIYVSKDSGATWTAPHVPQGVMWTAVGLSADGNELCAGAYGTPIYNWQAPPKLSINPSGPGSLVSWRAAASRFALQQSASAWGGTWTDVGMTPGVTNGLNQVLVSPTGGQNFYRLQSR